MILWLTKIIFEHMFGTVIEGEALQLIMTLGFFELFAEIVILILIIVVFIWDTIDRAVK